MFSSLIDINKDFENKFDYKILKSLISKVEVSEIIEVFAKYKDDFPNQMLSMNDGYFMPYPYSVIHQDLNTGNKLLNDYFQKAYITREKLKFNNGLLLNDFFSNLLKKIFLQQPILLDYHNQYFSSLGLRYLYAEKNGIDIHCENAFVHQLAPDFSNWLINKLDLFNSVSFFILLQKPEEGGELVLYDKFWDDFKLNLNESTYDERHDLNGILFTKRGVADVKKEFINLNAGDAIFFPAAQRWHAINKINGAIDRISIGCFLAKGKDGKLYYWA
jgi:hypothetical protein